MNASETREMTDFIRSLRHLVADHDGYDRDIGERRRRFGADRAHDRRKHGGHSIGRDRRIRRQHRGGGSSNRTANGNATRFRGRWRFEPSVHEHG